MAGLAPATITTASAAERGIHDSDARCFNKAELQLGNLKFIKTTTHSPTAEVIDGWALNAIALAGCAFASDAGGIGAKDTSVLTFSCEDAFLSKVLTIFRDKTQVLQAETAKPAHFYDALAVGIKGLNPVDLLELQLRDTDIKIPSPFNTPAVAGRGGGGRGGGGRGGGGRPGVPGPPELNALHLVTLGRLSKPDSTLPLLTVAKLLVQLGDRTSDAERRSATSDVRAAATALAEYAGVALGRKHLPALNDVQLARRMGELIDGCELPIEFQASSWERDVVEAELSDGYVFRHGEPTHVQGVVRKRLHYACVEYEKGLGMLFDDTLSADDRLDAVIQVAALKVPLLRMKNPSALLKGLNVALVEGSKFSLNQYVTDGIAGLDRVKKYMADERLVKSAQRSDGGNGGGHGGTAADDSPPPLGERAVDDAIDTAEFQTSATEILDLDTTSMSDRKKALEIAFDSGVMLYVMVLAYPSHPIRRRHPVFDHLLRCESALPWYFGEAQAWDFKKDAVEEGLEMWRYTSEQCRLALRGGFTTLHMVNGAGHIGMRNTLRVDKLVDVPESQLYTVKACWEKRKKFHGATLMAMGYPEKPSAGMSHADFCDSMMELIDLAADQEEGTKKELLQFVDEVGREADADAEAEHKAQLRMTQVGEAAFDAWLVPESSFERRVADKLDTMKPMLKLLKAFPHLGKTAEAAAPSSLPGVVLPTTTKPAASGGALGAGKGGPGAGKVKAGAAAAAGGAPGSNKGLFTWLDDSWIMVAGGRKFDVDGICKMYKLDKNKVCMPFLLTSKEGRAALTVCPTPDNPQHKGANAEAHQKPTNWDYVEVCKKYSKPATNAEKRKASSPSAHGKRPKK